jgi:uncharacterized Zn finger protein
LRLLIEGRLTVQRCGDGNVLAICRGDSGEFYQLASTRGGWSCDCPMKGRCSHLTALMRVVAPSRAVVLQEHRREVRR